MRFFLNNSVKLCVFSVSVLIITLSSCRKENEIIPTPIETTQGFYLLNEGNMGTNKCTLDYYDFETGTYHRNIYAGVNPHVPKELGDVGNDLLIYGSKMYAVISCSNKIEVMEAKTAKRIGQIEIPNCHNVICSNGYLYVTSYAGTVVVGPNQQIGYVAKIDTTSLQITDRCNVGFQPDGLDIANGKIYVANSGGYLIPNYENSVSVIDLGTFKETRRITVSLNLHRVCADKHGNVWVSARGDYLNTPSKLYCINAQTDQLTDSINIPVSNFYLDEDKLYIISAIWGSTNNEISYKIVDVVSKQIISNNFITDGTTSEIKMPYGIAVDPRTKDIYVTDAKNYVTPGTLYCFDKEGKQKWNVRTGDIPAHFAFLKKSENYLTAMDAKNAQ